MKISLWHGAVAGCVVAGCVAAGVLVGVPSAQAASGHQPFAQDAPAALIARPDASGAEQLYKKSLSGQGEATLEKVGEPWQGIGGTKKYNALGFNKTDGYAYAVSGGYEEPGGHLLQIGSDGSVVDLGPLLGDAPEPGWFVNNGTIVDGRHLLVSAFNGNTLWSIDVQTRVVTATSLSQTWKPADFVSNGDQNVLWGFHDVTAYRLDLRTGEISGFPLSGLSFTGGAVFSYPNGDFGLSADNGNLYRLRVTSGDADVPRFTIVSTSSTPSSSTADGTAIGENTDVFPPFTTGTPLGLWASSIPGGTQLHAVDPTRPEAPATLLGTPWTGNGRVDTYNAIAFNKADGYVYAITGNDKTADNRLIKVASNGAVREIGRLQHATEGWMAGNFLHNGTIVGDKLLATSKGARWLLSVDLTTAKYTQIDLSDEWKSSDFATNDGVYLWGIDRDRIQRLEIATGKVTTFANTVTPTSVRVGGIMNGSEGDFIASSNDSETGTTQGTVYRFHVTNPASDAPTFTLVATGTGPVAGDNDGTSTLDAR